jgi:phage gp16-like protein
MSKITPPEVGSYAGGAVAIGTSLTLTQVGIIVGIVTALLTFGLNAWYTHQKNARERVLADLDRREREVRLAQLLAQLQAPEVKP